MCSKDHVADVVCCANIGICGGVIEKFGDLRKGVLGGSCLLISSFALLADGANDNPNTVYPMALSLGSCI